MLLYALCAELFSAPVAVAATEDKDARSLEAAWVIDAMALLASLIPAEMYEEAELKAPTAPDVKVDSAPTAPDVIVLKTPEAPEIAVERAPPASEVAVSNAPTTVEVIPLKMSVISADEVHARAKTAMAGMVEKRMLGVLRDGIGLGEGELEYLVRR